MRGAEAIDEYIALPQQEAFDIEYWLLEEAKLQRMPAEKELARQIVAVIGSGSGIGREVAQRIAREGATIVCVDVNAAAAEGTGEGARCETRGSASASRAAESQTAVRLSGFPATSRNAKASRPCSTRSSSPTAGPRCHRAHRRYLRPARHQRPHSRRKVGADLRHQCNRQLSRRG